MKQFLAFITKEFYHIFRDRRTMLILLAMPIVQIVLFGFAISTELNNVRVGVLNPSNDVLSRQITDRINASEYFTVYHLLASPQEMDDLFRAGKIDMAVVFNPSFMDNIYKGESAIQLVSDATDPNMATMQMNYASNIIRSALTEQQSPHTVSIHTKLLYNPQMKSAYNFVPGVMGLIMMLICAMMTSISIVREKETGTMEILLVSPLKPMFVILSKVVPYFFLSCINLTTILLLSVYVLGVPIAGSLYGLILLSLLFIFVALSLGVLISSIATTQVAAMLGSGLILMMPTILLSGMVFPIENMPIVLQWISAIIPARWYIEIVRRIMIQGVDVWVVAKEVIILILMGVVFTGLSLKLFKNRL